MISIEIEDKENKGSRNEGCEVALLLTEKMELCPAFTGFVRKSLLFMLEYLYDP
jgi:hypothetical protein